MAVINIFGLFSQKRSAVNLKYLLTVNFNQLFEVHYHLDAFIRYHGLKATVLQYQFDGFFNDFEYL